MAESRETLYTGDVVTDGPLTGAEVVAEFAPEVEVTEENIAHLVQQFDLHVVESEPEPVEDAPDWVTPETHGSPVFVSAARLYRDASHTYLSGQIDRDSFEAIDVTSDKDLATLSETYHLTLGPQGETTREGTFRTANTGSWINDMSRLAHIVRSFGNDVMYDMLPPLGEH